MSLLPSTLIVLTLAAAAAGALLVPAAPAPAFYAYAPAAAYNHQFHSQDSLGQYAYGYSGALSSKTETKTLDGITRGSYSYIDANNQLQTVEYTADAVNGFRAAATNLPKAPIDERLAPLPVQETIEVAAARAEHMAAYEAAILRNEQQQKLADDEQQEVEAAADEDVQPEYKPRIVTPQPDAFLAPNAFAYAAHQPALALAPAPPTGAFSYSYSMPAGGNYLSYGAAAYPAFYPAGPALRPAALQYAYSAQPAFAFKRFQPALVQPAPLAAADAKPAFLRGAVEQRPFVVTDTVAVRAERFTEEQHKAARAAFESHKAKVAATIAEQQQQQKE